jgi:arylsulfatase
VGRVLSRLDDLEIADNTIVIFLTDNGPQQRRYIAGMRGKKSDVYRGGVRVPLFIRYPGLIDRVSEVETTAAHIDMMPTLASICSADLPADRTIDGNSLLPLMSGNTVEWADRPLFFNWTRKYPELYRNIALQKGPYKLVGNTDYNAPIENFELYDLKEDPYELNNIVMENKGTAESLKSDLDEIYRELINSDNLQHPPLIMVGTAYENPVVLNRNDAKGERGIWAQEKLYGDWDVAIQEGRYDIMLKFIKPLPERGHITLETGTLIHRMLVDEAGQDIVEMKDVSFPELKGSLRPFFASKSGEIFPFWVEMRRID